MSYTSHPAAELFPMLAPDELEALADDIRKRGLLEPIVVDGNGRIIDGRNRWEACNLAGVRARTVTYTGDDPIDESLSRNLARRHLTPSQRAMVATKYLDMKEREAAERKSRSASESNSARSGPRGPLRALLDSEALRDLRSAASRSFMSRYLVATIARWDGVRWRRAKLRDSDSSMGSSPV